MCSLYSNGGENWILTANEVNTKWNVDIIRASNGIEHAVCLTCDGPSAISLCICLQKWNFPLLPGCAHDGTHAQFHENKRKGRVGFLCWTSQHRKTVIKALGKSWSKDVQCKPNTEGLWVKGSIGQLTICNSSLTFSSECQWILSTTNFATKIPEFKGI